MRKACLITGASKGIGAAIAQKFSEQGFFVYLVGRDEKALDDTRKSLAHPEKSRSFRVDFLDESKVKDLAKELTLSLATENLSLITLVNNAGIFRRQALLPSEALEAQGPDQGPDQWPDQWPGRWQEVWRNQMQVNFFAAALLTELLIPELKKNSKDFPGEVSIVNVSSTLGFRVIKEVAAYGATKAAMNLWTQSLALELAPHIRANAVCPGLVDTPIHPFHFLEGENKVKALQSMSGMQPMGRIGRPRDIAEAVWFLASPQSSWTTGALLPVDGGISLV
jgi:NAD(P)-dependent dehydrogenase (short-subunit alcohol dehydrogenase family)